MSNPLFTKLAVTYTEQAVAAGVLHAMMTRSEESTKAEYDRLIEKLLGAQDDITKEEATKLVLEAQTEIVLLMAEGAGPVRIGTLLTITTALASIAQGLSVAEVCATISALQDDAPETSRDAATEKSA